MQKQTNAIAVTNIMDKIEIGPTANVRQISPEFIICKDVSPNIKTK